MSEHRFSAWQVGAVVVVVLGLTGAALVGGVALGYFWGRANGRAAGLADQPQIERAPAPFQVLTQMPFDRPKAPEFAAQPYLGVEFVMITPELAEAENLAAEEGALVRAVLLKTPAAEAGLELGDIIQQVNGEPVDVEHPLPERIRAFKPGDEVTLEVLREGQTHEIGVTLGERPLPELPRLPEGLQPGFEFDFQCSPGPCPDLPFFDEPKQNAPSY